MNLTFSITFQFFTDSKLQDLITAADRVKENAYCPYSNFRVGASVLCADGSIYAGIIFYAIFTV